MKLGSTSIQRERGLDDLLHRLYEELLKETQVCKAFYIVEEKGECLENGEEYTYFKLNDIPIETEHLTIPSNVKPQCNILNMKYSFKERLRILFKGGL